MFGYFPLQPIKNNAVLEPRTGHFRGVVGFEAKAKDFKMCPRGHERPRGLHLCLMVVMKTSFVTVMKTSLVAVMKTSLVTVVKPYLVKVVQSHLVSFNTVVMNKIDQNEWFNPLKYKGLANLIKIQDVVVISFWLLFFSFLSDAELRPTQQIIPTQPLLASIRLQLIPLLLEYWNMTSFGLPEFSVNSPK